MTQVTVTCTEDVRQYGGATGYFEGSTYNRVVSHTSVGSTQGTGLRFPALSVPEGATIDSAILKIYAINTTYDDVLGEILAELTLDPDVFADAVGDDVYRRTPLTAASVTWDATSLGTAQVSSPDIKAVIQELVDQSGWDASTQDLVLLFHGAVSATARELRISAIERSGSYTAELVVDYTVSVASDLQAIVDGQSDVSGYDAYEFGFDPGSPTAPRAVIGGAVGYDFDSGLSLISTIPTPAAGEVVMVIETAAIGVILEWPGGLKIEATANADPDLVDITVTGATGSDVTIDSLTTIEHRKNQQQVVQVTWSGATVGTDAVMGGGTWDGNLFLLRLWDGGSLNPANEIAVAANNWSCWHPTSGWTNDTDNNGAYERGDALERIIGDDLELSYATIGVAIPFDLDARTGAEERQGFTVNGTAVIDGNGLQLSQPAWLVDPPHTLNVAHDSTFDVVGEDAAIFAVIRSKIAGDIVSKQDATGWEIANSTLHDRPGIVSWLSTGGIEEASGDMVVTDNIALAVAGVAAVEFGLNSWAGAIGRVIIVRGLLSEAARDLVVALLAADHEIYWPTTPPDWATSAPRDWQVAKAVATIPGGAATVRPILEWTARVAGDETRVDANGLYFSIVEGWSPAPDDDARDYLEVQRSVDSGEWERVTPTYSRDMVLPEVTVLEFVDRFLPTLVPVEYRARFWHIEPGVLQVTTWSAVDTFTLTLVDDMLRHPTDPALDLTVTVESHSDEIIIPSATFDPAEDVDYGIVLRSGSRGSRGTTTIAADSAAEGDLIVDLLKSGPVLLQFTTGRQWWIEAVDSIGRRNSGVVDASGGTGHESITVKWRSVKQP